LLASRFLAIAVLLAELIGLPQPATAKEPMIGNDLTVSQMVQQLKPNGEVKVRDGISVDDSRTVIPNKGPRPPEPPVAYKQPALAEPPSLNIQVNFEFNSAELKPESKELLDRVGQALQSNELTGYRFQIAGHTDAVGSSAYNKSLSQRRAAAVRDYLVKNFGVKDFRLESVGYGKERLLDPDHPTSPINRRVQLVNLGRT